MSQPLKSVLLALAMALLLSGCVSDEVPLATDRVFTKWRTWTKADGLPSDTVWAVLPAKGGVWVGTTGGLAFFDGKSFQTWGTKDGLVHRAVTSLAIDPQDNALWIGTLGGVSCLTPTGFRNFKQSTTGLVNDVIYAVAVQGDTIWMASTNGLSGMDKRTGAFTTYDERNAPFHENWCYGATVVGEKLYLAVWGGGLCIRDARTGEWENYMDPDADNRVDLLAGDGILSDVVVTASVSNGKVWVASYFGAGMFDGSRWKAYSTRNSGLPRNFVNTVKASGDGCWVGSDTGLCWFDGDRRWITYRRVAGRDDATATFFDESEEKGTLRLDGSLGSNFIWAVAEESKERVWVGTAAGLSLGTMQ